MTLYLVFMNSQNPKPDQLGAMRVSLFEPAKDDAPVGVVTFHGAIGKDSAPGYPFQFATQHDAFGAIAADYHRLPSNDDTELNSMPVPWSYFGDRLVVACYYIAKFGANHANMEAHRNRSNFQLHTPTDRVFPQTQKDS